MSTKIITSDNLQLGKVSLPIEKAYLDKANISTICGLSTLEGPYIKYVSNQWKISNDGTTEISIGPAIVNVSLTGSVEGTKTSWNTSTDLEIPTEIVSATVAEVTAGTEDTKAVTPSVLLKAKANGTASLDERIKVPLAQLPVTISQTEPTSLDGKNGDFWLVVE